MRKRHFILFVLVLLLGTEKVMAESSVNDIFITVVLPERNEIPQEAKQQLDSKLHQIITSNGIADTDPNGRFVITVKCNVLTKDVVGSTPQRISQKIEFVFMIGDVIENKVFENLSLTLMGVGINENKSYIDAINKIKITNPQFPTFIEQAKAKILQYYEVRCEQVVNEAKRYATQQDYQHAIYILMQVPHICDCSETTENLLIEYYSAYEEYKAAKLLNDAKMRWAASPDANGASLVADILSEIPAGSKIQSELDSLIAEINQKLREDEKRDWKFKMQQYQDEIARQKREYQLQMQQQESQNEARRQAIEACRQIGLEFARNYQPPVYYIRNILLW